MCFIRRATSVATLALSAIALSLVIGSMVTRFATSGSRAPAAALVDKSANVEPDTIAAAESLVRYFTTLLGAPRVPLHVAIGTERASMDPIATIPFPRDTRDIGRVRACLRSWTPAWYGRAFAEDREARTDESWFLVGLSEVLAYRSLADVGLCERDWRTAIESPWVREPALREVDVRKGRSKESLRERRGLCAVHVYELMANLPDGETIQSLLAGYDGVGCPRFPPGDARSDWLARFESTFVAGRARAAFEDNWVLRGSAAPPSGDGLSGDVVALAFTSNTQGLLALCHCPTRPAGGLARRAYALGRLRDVYPALCVFDLGAFSNGDGQRAHHDFYVEQLASLGYDALTIDPFEFYADSSRLATRERCHSSWMAPPYVGCGITIDGRELFSPSVVLSRGGLRIGYIGASELLECRGPQEALEGNIRGVSFVGVRERLALEARKLADAVDLLVIGGSLHPQTVRELCAPELGVDVVLLGGSCGGIESRVGARGFIGFIEDTLVVSSTTTYGLEVLELLVSEGRVTWAKLDGDDLAEEAPADPEVEASVARVLGERPEED